MKSIQQTMRATFLILLLASCNIEVPEEATLNINDSSGTSNLFGQDYDYEYGDTLGDNFTDYDVYENDSGFYMDTGGGGMQMPPKRPTCHKGSANSYRGKSINGGSIGYQPGQSNSWQISGSTNELIAYGESTNRMIGVMENGVPVYVRSSRNMRSNLDEYGGTYSSTNDFPDGVYHYVIVINL